MKTAILLLAIPLTACAATQAKLETDGAIIADDVRSAAELTLCKAIIRHENGRVIYSDAQVSDGVARALA